MKGSAEPASVLPGGTVTCTLKITSLDLAAYNCRIGPFIEPRKTKFLDNGKNGLPNGARNARNGYVEVPIIPKNSSVTITCRASVNDDARDPIKIFNNKTALKTEGVCGTYSRAENVAASLPAICMPLQVNVFLYKIVFLSLLRMHKRDHRARNRNSVPTFYFHPDKPWRINLQDMFKVVDLRSGEERSEYKEKLRVFMDPDDKRKPELPKLDPHKRGYAFSDITKIQDVITRRRWGFHRCRTDKLDLQ